MSRKANEIRHRLTEKLFTEKLPFYLALGAWLGTLCIHLLTIAYRTALHHDVAFNLTAGKITWQGAIPFVDLIDVNPPMIFYVNALPAAMAEMSGISLPVVGLLFFFAVVVLSGWIFTAALSLNLRLSWTQRFVIWTFWLWLSLQAFQNQTFGQREQLSFVLLTPFVCLRHARYAGVNVSRWFAGLVGICAFVALAMKPQFIIPLAMVEGAYWIGRKRSLRPLISIEIVAVAILSAIYLLHFCVVPGMSDFYTVWLPFTIKGYSSFSISKRTVVYHLCLRPYFLAYAGGALLAVAMPLVCRRRFWLIVGAMGWFSLGSLLVFIQQSKGWEYQRLPFLRSSQLAIFLSLFYCVRTQVSRPQRNLVQALGAVALMVTCSPEIVSLGCDACDKQPFQLPRSVMVDLITSLTEPTDPVLILGTSIRPSFPALTYADRPYASRFLTAYPIAFMFQDARRKTGYAVPAQWRSEEPMIYRMFTEDIDRWRPRLVLVKSTPNGQGLWNGFVYLDYLKRKGLFTTTMQDYRRVGFSDGFDVYYLPRILPIGEPQAIPVKKLQVLKKMEVLQ